MSATIKRALGGFESESESFEDFRAFLRDPHFVHYIGMSFPARPGVTECIEYLENRYYPPDTPQNALFSFRIIELDDVGFVFVSIPVGDQKNMEEATQGHGLKVTKTIPVLISGGSAHTIPYVDEKEIKDRVFSLTSNRGGPSNKTD